MLRSDGSHLVKPGTEFRVVSAPAPWNSQVFVADDTGGRITGKHFDIYCGAGSGVGSNFLSCAARQSDAAHPAHRRILVDARSA
jgi:3D domain